MPNFNQMSLPNVCLLVFSALVTLFLLIGAITDMNRKSRFMSSFIILLISNILMQLGEAGIWLFAGKSENIVLLNISAIMSMVFSYVLISAYAHCLTEFIRERKKVSFVFDCIILAVCSIYIILSIISPFNGMLFSFDDNGYFVYGPMYVLVRAFDVIAIVIEILLVQLYRRILTLRERIFLLSFGVITMLAMTLQPFWESVPQYLAVTLSLIVMYVLFHGEITRQLAENKIQFADSRISIMLSQIQPHFLHNTISVISDLCYKNPEQACEALKDFSNYLRGNIDSLSSRSLVHFTKELMQIDAYLKLEKLRFGDRLNIVYDIEAKDFFVPSLTIQPLIENAVKHGICEKESGGTLTLRTRSDDSGIVIEIIDDGIGFDMQKEVIGNDGHIHIGIQNVKNRLEQMAHGSLTIQSVLGKGTTITVRLAKNTAEGEV